MAYKGPPEESHLKMPESQAYYHQASAAWALRFKGLCFCATDACGTFVLANTSRVIERWIVE